MLETFGRYELIRKLATGGMGQIYLARQLGPVGFHKLVVVKRLIPHLSQEQEFIQMFFDEARIAAYLNHPNIAQIYDLGDVRGTHYITMEFVHGENLRATAMKASVELDDGIPLGLRCRAIADAAAGLDFAHHATSPSGRKLEVVHRDVSPQNILLGFSGAVKLIDFGVAKAAGKITNTATGVIKGKYAYMSPEQARGSEDLDGRSDIFALGIVFHELLTGTRLFKRDNDANTLKAVVTHDAPPPSSLDKSLPKGLDAIVLKALEKNPKHRYQRARDLQDAIEDFVVKERLPATASHLGAFMRKLYPEESAADFLSGEITASFIMRSPGEQTDVTDGNSLVELSAVSQVEPKSKSSSKPSGKGAPEEPSSRIVPGELSKRLKALGDGDAVHGIFLGAVAEYLVQHASAVDAAKLLKKVLGGRPIDETLTYPTAQFLKLLYEAVAAAGGQTSHLEALGAAAFTRLWGTALGKVLRNQRESTGGALRALAGSLQSMVNPGQRKLEKSATQSAVISFKGEVVPLPFFSGFFIAATKKLTGSKPTAVWTTLAAERHELGLRW